MAFTNIDKPDSFLGVESFERSNGSPRNPFDAAHGFGDALWRSEMGDYQDAPPNNVLKLDGVPMIAFGQAQLWVAGRAEIPDCSRSERLV